MALSRALRPQYIGIHPSHTAYHFVLELFSGLYTCGELLMVESNSVSSLSASQCTYFRRDGPCTQRGFGGRCHAHKNSPSHVPCRSGCGRYTLSKTRYCNKCGPGVNGHQQVVALQMRKKQLQCEAEWDAYIDECMKSADMVLDLTNPAPPSGP